MKYLRLIFSSPLLMIILVLVLGLSGATIYFYQKSKSATSPEQITLAETNALIKEVGKIMVLPENETPTVATVSDPSALKGQEFFVDAKKGDKVLIYTTTKKAILYDPSAKKIVNVAPISIGASAGTVADTPAQ